MSILPYFQKGGLLSSLDRRRLLLFQLVQDVINFVRFVLYRMQEVWKRIYLLTRLLVKYNIISIMVYRRSLYSDKLLINIQNLLISVHRYLHCHEIFNGSVIPHRILPIIVMNYSIFIKWTNVCVLISTCLYNQEVLLF